MYNWRKMTEEQREELLKFRRIQQLPWHSPPHRAGDRVRYHITAACFEHRPIIGYSLERMSYFENKLLELLSGCCAKIYAWAVLPNHYHVLVKTGNILEPLKQLGREHGRISFRWNGEEKSRGRQVWCNALETTIKSEKHFWSSMNYIHNNPVRHGYVGKWQDWPFSSANRYLTDLGDEKAKFIWNKYPVTGYGDGWDDPDI